MESEWTKEEKEIGLIRRTNGVIALLSIINTDFEKC